MTGQGGQGGDGQEVFVESSNGHSEVRRLANTICFPGCPRPAPLYRSTILAPLDPLPDSHFLPGQPRPVCAVRH